MELIEDDTNNAERDLSDVFEVTVTVVVRGPHNAYVQTLCLAGVYEAIEKLIPGGLGNAVCVTALQLLQKQN